MRYPFLKGFLICALCFRDPLTNINIFRFATFVDKVYEMRSKGNKNWHWTSFSDPVDILDWNNFCFSYSVSKRQVKLVHNGILEVNETRPIEVQNLEDFVSSSWFGPYTSCGNNDHQFQVSCREGIT